LRLLLNQVQKIVTEAQILPSLPSTLARLPLDSIAHALNPKKRSPIILPEEAVTIAQFHAIFLHRHLPLVVRLADRFQYR